MSKVAVWAKIPVHPGKRDEAVAVLSEHAIANVQRQGGVAVTASPANVVQRGTGAHGIPLVEEQLGEHGTHVGVVFEE